MAEIWKIMACKWICKF